MKLSELIAGIDQVQASGPVDLQVCDLAYDASRATPGSCFFALRGSAKDGCDFASDAISRGAVAVVSERPVALSGGATNVVVSDARLALGIASSRMLGEPSKEMAMVGVTGTNGKTTTTYLMESILRAQGRKPGVIGTIEYRYAGRRVAASHTTPQSLDLQRLLREMRDAGIDSCAIEVSSHALTQQRVAGCRFDCAVFTNLTPEHLDYHSDMDDYFEAKAMLFERYLKDGGKPGACAVINADDEYGMRLASRCDVPVIFFGTSKSADVSASKLEYGADGIRMEIRSPAGSFEVSSHLCGRFNAQNILGAAAVGMRLGVDIDSIQRGIAAVSSVPGRFEPVPNEKGLLALVDYAHTPDALEKALSHAKELVGAEGGRLIAVFGCGGDRDRKKRPLMGRAAASIADIVIVTSDNPRSEDPMSIIGEILPGVREAMPASAGDRGYEVISDRREAICKAVGTARRGDVIVVAGKGHEDYQIVGSRRLHFDDREVLSEFLNR